MISKFFFASLGLALICGCAAALPAPTPLDKERSIIGISVNVRAPIRLFSNQAQRVYFVRIESGEPTYQEALIASNYTKGDYVYLLNARPGRYAAVAASSSNVSRGPLFPSTSPSGPSMTVRFTSTIYLSEKLIRASVVEVKPATVAFMGEFIVDSSIGVEGADPAQAHYYRLLEPGAETRSAFATLMSGEQAYRAADYQSDHSNIAQQKFLDYTRQAIEEAGWTSVLQNPVKADKP